MVVGQRLAELIKQAGGSVTSLIPPRPGEHITFEVRPDLAEKVTTMLANLGYQINRLGAVQKLVATATVETITERMPDGTLATRSVDHPGLATVEMLELLLPSEDELSRALAPPSTPRRLSRTEEIDRRKKIHRKVTA
jgi:hypothetical protein